MIETNRRRRPARGTTGDDEATGSGGPGSEPGSGDVAGVVLAGGYSRRFGDRDKALARLAGRPLLARVVARLGAATDSVVVNCRADQRAAFADALDLSADSETGVDVPVRFAPDPVPDRGPLFGFRTALRAVEAETCALSACDTPFLDPRLLSDLADRLTADSAAEAVAVVTKDRPHPVPAVYRTAPALEACDALLDAGDGRLSALFDRLAVRRVSADDAVGDVARNLFDVDTPEDRERAAVLLADRTSSERGREATPPR
ncbi:molybdenum cofactor guanylyltransferase [Halorussus rarus]|uniref:molybdenum cofactor guanylyltransferase n=1 Tax=Halorussus TaxID=1070314 RepID=UPI001963F056|nr:molybdenum cofactor guanylyltransferase [Halorussus rarus]